LNIYTEGNSGQVFLSTAGNVGIGTTGPASKLEIARTGATNAQLLTLSDDGTSGISNGELLFNNTGAGGIDFGVGHILNNTSFAIRDLTNSGSPYRVLIDTSGNVGIGTTSPTNLLSLSGQAARIIWTERNVTAATAGLNLTLRVGGAVVGGTNLGGGSLILAGGISTGTGTSDVQIQTCPAGSTGTADNALTTIIQATGNALGFFGHAVAVQQAYTAVSDPPTQAQVTAIRDALINLGLMAAS